MLRDRDCRTQRGLICQVWLHIADYVVERMHVQHRLAHRAGGAILTNDSKRLAVHSMLRTKIIFGIAVAKSGARLPALVITNSLGPFTVDRR